MIARCLIFLHFVSLGSTANLVMMQAIWRHGDRAPGELPYPNDRYNETYWPRGWDQLTNILRPTKVKCPNYDLANSNEEAPLAAQINTEYGQMFKWLQNTTGMESIDFWNINDLYDIQREIDHNMPQPSWLNQVFNGTTIMDHIRELKRITRNQEFNSPTKAKFRGGMLVNQFLENMENLKANKTTKNAIMYSSHDGTLSALLYALNVSNDQLVPYTATVIFELYDDDTVQLFYKNSTTTAYPLAIPGCLQICPYSQFLELLEGVRVRSLDILYSLCGTYSSSSTSIPTTGTPSISTSTTSRTI
uniref:Lysosomal acid phosphatase n=1 Tax=Caenorhabditis tropicalis TaxID=1561998 RepID=A0A1I7V4E2_9PELO